MTFAEICKNEGIELGMQKGIVVGRVEGRVEGESTVLIELLECRFGEIPEYYRDLIQQADSDRLLTSCKKKS